MKKTMFVMFSGGRTSGYMCWWLKKHKSDEYSFVFMFANTGQEHEKTLEFVDKCDKRLGLNLVWLEAVVHHGERKGSTHKIVTYETASRNGEPFEQVILSYGIPNKSWPNCNRELKIHPANSYMRSLGFKTNHVRAIGIRSDEIDRMNLDAIKRGEIIYPLIKWHPVTKSEVLHWWAEQGFDLDLPEHLGNCITCWKKSDRKLMTIAKQEPKRFNFFRSMEKHGNIGPQHDGDRVFFRGRRTVDDIFEMAKQPFKEFKDNMPELQLRLFDPIDFTNGCSESCEAA